MNNNRGNNRRRGRGNNRPQGGGGQQLNRIDSRARGNAPQLLEKYRKLAHDAHLNGDRVTEEYYLQFADHYFRVIADTRQRQEDQRQRRDERWDERTDDGEDQNEFGADSDYAPYDQPPQARQREADGSLRQREDRESRDNSRDGDGRAERSERSERAERPERPERPERGNRRERTEEVAEPAETGESEERRSIYEPAENPFLRENRASRGLRPRREERRPRRESEAAPDAEPAFDMAVLPPAINAGREPAVEPAPEPAAEAPAPKRRTRKPKVVAEAPAEVVDEG